MSRRDDPFEALPFAVAGLLVGVGLNVLCGTSALSRWTADPGPGMSNQAVVEGTVEWAGWRQSAHAEGPVWFLQLRLTTDPRGFLIAESALIGPLRERLRQEQPLENGAQLSSLIGAQAAIGVAPRFQKPPRPSTPYVQTLRIDGTAVVPSGPASSDADGPYDWIAHVLIGIGMLVGLGVTGVSAHHLVICVRYRAAEA
jgi:hypothetical protein